MHVVHYLEDGWCWKMVIPRESQEKILMNWYIMFMQSLEKSLCCSLLNYAVKLVMVCADS